MGNQIVDKEIKLLNLLRRRFSDTDTFIRSCIDLYDEGLIGRESFESVLSEFLKNPKGLKVVVGDPCGRPFSRC